MLVGGKGVNRQIPMEENVHPTSAKRQPNGQLKLRSKLRNFFPSNELATRDGAPGQFNAFKLSKPLSHSSLLLTCCSAGTGALLVTC